MKIFALIILVCFCACSGDEQKSNTSKDTAIKITQPPAITPKIEADSTQAQEPANKVYSNTRFKDVVVKKLGNNKYKITGKAQIFEANFGWVIEDGHDELQKGNTMTDAGAPEWGKFDFVVEAKKKRENSTLHLILFESSAKDGSRVYELPVLLY